MTATRTSNPNDITILRTYDAPLQAVWDAWTDPAQAAQWWGPRGFTLTTHAKDLRSGGSWTYTMHGPDGTDYPNKTVYLEVEPMARLVYDHGGNDDRPPMFRVTVLFTHADGKTHMDMTMHFPDAAAAQQGKVFIKQAGGNGTWDRLAEYMARRLLDQERFIINRSFDAPRERVFAMWTAPAHLAQWMGPAGGESRILPADVRPHDEANTIVYTQQFRDEDEKLTHNPLAPVWPETLRVIVDLSTEGSDRTRVTVTTSIAGPASAQEVAAFTSARGQMAQDWNGAFDKLENALA